MEVSRSGLLSIVGQNSYPMIGQGDVGLKSAYIHSGIIAMTTYTVTAYLRDSNGKLIQLNAASDILTATKSDDAKGSLSNFIINNDGTFSFTYQTGESSSPETADGFAIYLNGENVLGFWTSGY